MSELKDFRKANGLSQRDLANYLGVGQGFVSQMETGTSKIPDDIYSKIKSNTAWDTTMLNTDIISNDISAAKTNNISTTDMAVLHAKVEMLEKQLAEEKARSTEYWNLLKDAISRSRG